MPENQVTKLMHELTINSILAGLLKSRAELVSITSNAKPDYSRLVKAEEYIRLAIEELRD